MRYKVEIYKPTAIIEVDADSEDDAIEKAWEIDAQNPRSGYTFTVDEVRE